MIQERQEYTKAKPKQDFNIRHSTIMNSKWLTMPLRVWLYIILERHKVFNKKEYQYITNQELRGILGITVPTLIKQRDVLERLNLIEVMCKVKGKLTVIDSEHRKNQPLYYRPIFASLLKHEFIEPIEMSQFQKDFRETTRKKPDKVKSKPLKIGEVLNHVNSKALNSNKKYNIIFKTIENGNTTEMVCEGFTLKKGLREDYDNKEDSGVHTLFYGECKNKGVVALNTY